MAEIPRPRFSLEPKYILLFGTGVLAIGSIPVFAGPAMEVWQKLFSTQATTSAQSAETVAAIEWTGVPNEKDRAKLTAAVGALSLGLTPVISPDCRNNPELKPYLVAWIYNWFRYLSSKDSSAFNALAPTSEIWKVLNDQHHCFGKTSSLDISILMKRLYIQSGLPGVIDGLGKRFQTTVIMKIAEQVVAELFK